MTYELVIGREVHELPDDWTVMERRLRYAAIANPGVAVFVRAREGAECVFVSGNCPPHDLPTDALYAGVH